MSSGAALPSVAEVAFLHWREIKKQPAKMLRAAPLLFLLDGTIKIND